MAKSALIGTDEGRSVIYHEEGEKRFIETREDVSHIERAAKILSEEKPGKDFRRVALIPRSVLDKAMLEGWFHDESAWKRWANDPDNVAYRTWHGRV